MASELDDLRSFIEELFAEALPQFDTSSGSLVDTQVITPIINRFSPDPFQTPLDEFFRARLRSEFPELVIQKGEPIDDYAIKPLRIMMEPYRRAADSVARNQSLQDPSVLNDREADALAANYFASREQGGYSIGVARLFFNVPTFQQISPTNAVSTSSGLRFLPVENVAISPDAMLFNQSGSLYYFDVPVRAEEQGEDYNIDRGELVSIEGAPNVVRVTNLTKFEEGSPRETTTEFLARVQRSLTEKSLVTFRGIQARILELFDSVRSIAVIGYGSPEMDRDIIKANPGADYAFGAFTAVNGSSSIFTTANGVTDGNPGNGDFAAIGLEVGDSFRTANLVAQTISEYTVTEVVSPFQARVTPAPPDIASPAAFTIRGPKRGQITLSDIPGGIVVPQTTSGEIVVNNDELHIGGVYDVFVRGGSPIERTIQLTAIRDGDPLHFGLDLQTYGVATEYVEITDRITAGATTDQAWVGPGDVTAVLYIKVLDTGTGTTPWYPAAADVGRYVELLGVAAAGTDYGLYQIISIGALQDFGGERAIPVTISTTDQHTMTNTVGISDRVSTYDLDFRLVESISIADRVRDLDSPQVDFNGNNDGVGGEIGDSIVIENGTDAGIYTIRRILTSIGDDDVLVLDRDLTATVTPSGSGDGSGLRYRLVDELQLDLVDPRVVKMPLGDIFLANDLNTIAGNQTASSGSTSNFLLAGVEVGDTLEILSGSNAGEYTVDAVAAGNVTLTPAPTTTLNNQSFSIYRAFDGVERPMVRVKEVELLDANNQVTGITIPYGKEIDVRVLGTFSNRSNGDNVESYSGAVVSTATPLLTFEDLQVDFTAQGVVAGNRMEVFEGDNIGEYEIAQVAPGGNDNRLLIQPASDGGKDFVSVETQLHYQIGDPSTGIVRVYFLEPTSVEIDTGRLGGRIKYTDAGQDLTYRFSRVQGRYILPAPGSGDDDPRDIRVVRSYSVGGGQFETILERTDGAEPDFYDLEVEVGDVLEIQQQIHFRDTAGQLLNDAGVFGTPAGLRTITGSNRVSVPTSSHIDFTQMGDLSGQTLAINSGPDAGIYRIQRVIDSKTLELDAVMTATTVGIRGQDTATLYDAEILDVAGQPWLRDTTDSGQLGAVGEYITIYEAASTDPEGTFDIVERDIPNQRVRLNGFTGTFPVAAGTFTWVRTDSQTPSGVLEQPFTIYSSIGTEVQVTQVATKGTDVTALGTQGTVNVGLTTFGGPPNAFNGVVRGARLEILRGVNAGVYPVISATSTLITVYSAHPFSAIENNVSYRVWSGVHGPKTMLTVAGFEGTTGLIEPGQSIIYRARRPSLFRFSSTEMDGQQDESGLYYVDLQVESLGPGDDRNISEGARLVVQSGLRADGYTYDVVNNTLSFSPYEEVSLNFDRRFLPTGNSDLPENMTEVNGRNLQITYESSSTAQLIDDLLRSDTERAVNANPLGRHFLPSYVYTSLTYSGGSSQTVSGAEIEEYINNLGPLQELEVSDLEALLSRRGATSIRHPILLVSVTHDINRDLIVERSEDAIGGDSVPFEGSARISSFFADLEDGLNVTRL